MTPSTPRNIELEIKEILIAVSGMKQFKPSDIETNTPLFKEGLGLDSIDVLELVVRLEKRYGLKIKNDEFGLKLLQNVGTIVVGVEHHLAQTQQ